MSSHVWFYHFKCGCMQPPPVYIPLISQLPVFCLHNLLVETGPWHLFSSLHPWGEKQREHLFLIKLVAAGRLCSSLHHIVTYLFILYTCVCGVVFRLRALPCLPEHVTSYAPKSSYQRQLKVIFAFYYDTCAWANICSFIVDIWYYMYTQTGRHSPYI